MLGGVLIALVGWWVMRERAPAIEPPAAAARLAASAAPSVVVQAPPSRAASGVAMAVLEDLPATGASAPEPAERVSEVVAMAPLTAASASTSNAAAPQPEARPADPPAARASSPGPRAKTASAAPPKPKPPPKSQEKAQPRTAAAEPVARGDADVDLIAALMQHMSREAEKDLTIAELVARCKARPGAEAQRCRQRICENYWGRADACPRTAMPTTSRP